MSLASDVTEHKAKATLDSSLSATCSTTLQRKPKKLIVVAPLDRANATKATVFQTFFFLYSLRRISLFFSVSALIEMHGPIFTKLCHAHDVVRIDKVYVFSVPLQAAGEKKRAILAIFRDTTSSYSETGTK